MVVKKVAFLRIVALAVTLAGTALQPVRAEDSATPHGGDGGICARSEFRVLIDVGHTATSPGADSARGVPEYDFNLKLADVVAQSLHEAGVRQNSPIGHERYQDGQSVRACGER